LYKVLYRKWRPKIFDDVVGQEHITTVLKNQIISGCVSHAFIFCGTRGTGKTTCAKILSKAVNCVNHCKGNPCLKCNICLEIESGTILDIFEMDAASNNSVEDIRIIREEVNFVPSSAKYRVYIIDEFHMLSSGAFNALLKTLEEPPENVIFILATTEFHKIPKTIVSRCQKFNFYKVSFDKISEQLSYIASKENININKKAINLISKLSDGSVRDALSILDQCSSEKGNLIDEFKINNIIGLSNSREMEELIERLINSDLSECIKFVENLNRGGKDMVRLCEELMNYFYSLFYYNITNKINETCIHNDEHIKKIASQISFETSIFCFKILKNCYIQMSKISQKKAEIEMALLKIFKNINSKKEPISNKKSITSAEKKIKEIEIENKFDSKCGLNLFEKWDITLDFIEKKISKSISSMLSGSKVYVKNNLLIIDANDFVFDMVKKVSKKITNFVKEITGKNYEIAKFDSPSIEVTTNNVLDLLLEEARNHGIKVMEQQRKTRCSE